MERGTTLIENNKEVIPDFIGCVEESRRALIESSASEIFSDEKILLAFPDKWEYLFKPLDKIILAITEYLPEHFSRSQWQIRDAQMVFDEWFPETRINYRHQRSGGRGMYDMVGYNLRDENDEEVKEIKFVKALEYFNEFLKYLKNCEIN